MLKVIIVLAVSAAASANEKIVNGEIAEPNTFAYQVAIILKKEGLGTLLCGGSVITSKTILSAAHCLQGSARGLVIMGSHDLEANDTGIERRVVNSTDFRIHPDFDIRKAKFDIALIKLLEPVIFSQMIAPVKLPSSYQLDEPFSGEIGTVSGFGAFCDGCSSSHQLRFTKNMVMSNLECSKKFEINSIPSKTQICLSTTSAKSGTCRGDSGGPLTILRNNTPMQIGVSSFGSQKCEMGWPTVFTRLTREIVAWILKESKKQDSELD